MSRRKNKGRNRKMNKHQFQMAICNSCDICIYGSKPKFCFNKLYRSNPNKFMAHVPKMLAEHNNLLRAIVDVDPIANYIANAIFKKVFCDANVCHNCKKDAQQSMKCLAMFREQALAKTNSLIVSKLRKNPEKHHPAVVTIMSSQNSKFLKEVDRILENNIKQSN